MKDNKEIRRGWLTPKSLPTAPLRNKRIDVAIQ